MLNSIRQVMRFATIIPGVISRSFQTHKSVGWRYTFLAFRVLQLYVAVQIAILYGLDLLHAIRNDTEMCDIWIIAELFAIGTALVCFFCLLVSMPPLWSDMALILPWGAIFVFFGYVFLFGPPAPKISKFTTSDLNMKMAAYSDLISTLLWFGSGCLGIAHRKSRNIGRRTTPARPSSQSNQVQADLQLARLPSYRETVEVNAEGNQNDLESQAWTPLQMRIGGRP